jgi:hypothetical protein
LAAGGKDREAREARERARLYQARQQFNAGQSRRRTRDNLIVGIAGGVLILGLFGAQAAYVTVGPGAPAPTPSTTPVPSMDPSPSATPTPTPSATPTPTPTP